MQDPGNRLPHLHASPRDGVILADRIVCAAFCLLGGYICYSSVFDLNAFSSARSGSGGIPFLVGLLMIVSALVVLNKLRRNRLVDAEVRLPTAQEGARTLTLLALTIGAVVLIPLLGMTVSLALFLLIELRLLERRSTGLALATAILLPAGLYLLFRVLLNVPLPAGLLI